MEEKERYELFGEFGIIHDTSPNAECMLLNKFQTCEILNKQDKENQQLKQQLEKSEKSKELYRLQNEDHHLQLLQFYSRLGVEAFGADIHEKALETLMIMKEELEEKNGVERALSACNRQNDEFADMIKKLVNEKEELKQQSDNLMLNKTNLRMVIKWTSSKFNEYSKDEIVNKAYNLKPNEVLECRCGSYSEKGWCGGYEYKFVRTEDNLFITINDKETILDVVKIDNQINELKGEK